METQDSEIIKQIKDTIDKLAVFIQKDGGDIHFYSFDEATGTVNVTLSGACQGCAYIDDTISMGVEAILQEEVKGVERVKVVDQDGNPIDLAKQYVDSF